MIVLDASALVALVLHTSPGERIDSLINTSGIGLHTPYLADIEVAHALRRYARDRAVGPEAAGAALHYYRGLDLRRHDHVPLLDRIWALRENLSAYDATYVALAEALDCDLITCDARLAHAPGTAARVLLV